MTRPSAPRPATDARGERPVLERVRAVAEVSREVVYQARVDGVIEWVQPTVQFQLGWTPEEMVGTRAMEYVHPEDLPEASRLRLTVYEGTELDDIPCRFRGKDGEYHDCLVRARPVYDADGVIVGSTISLRQAGTAESAFRAVATLLAANTELVRATDEQELLGAMCRTIVATGGYELAWFGRKIPDGSIELLASAGPAAAILTTMPRWDGRDGTGGIAGVAIALGAPQYSADLHQPAFTTWASDIDRFALRSVVSIPVRVGGEIDGVLSVSADSVDAFDEQARALLENLADDLGYGLERLQEKRELTLARDRDEVQRRRLRGILDAQLDPLVLLAPVRDETGAIVDLEYIEANEAALRYNGLAYDEYVGKRFTELHPLLGENGVARRYMDVVETGEPAILDEYAYPNPHPAIGGEVRRYDVRAMPAVDGVALTWHDATSRFEARRRLEDSELRFRQLVENVSDVVVESDQDGVTTWITESCFRVLGWTAQEMLGRRINELLHPDEIDRVERIGALLRMGMTAHDEMRFRTASGEYRWMQVTAQVSNREGGPFGIVSLRDIHDQVNSRVELEFAVRHDPLTGLVTRGMLVRQLEQDAQERDGVHAVLTVGVDGLARVNEALTHVAGDAVIAGVASRVWEVYGDQERVARGSGDEIVIALAGLASGAEAGEIADRIRDSVRRPLDVAGHHLVPTVAVGIATCEPDETFDPDELLRTSTLAMREAKGTGGDRTVFVDPALAEAAGKRLSLEADLRAALATGELRPWFQPVVDIASGEIVGYEALVRWVLPDGTVRAPDHFLPVAERSHLVVDIDRAIITQCAALLRKLPSRRHIAVNVSARSIVRSDYVEHVLELIRSFEVPPDRLILEITETALFQDGGLVRLHMQRLADAGLRWYVDDFGTGYSSIAHLRDLPVAGLKLDKSFTQGIGEGDATCIRLAQALAGLASGLELDTVAEGVETEEEAAYLSAQGWKHGQGWLYGRPQPVPAHV